MQVNTQKNSLAMDTGNIGDVEIHIAAFYTKGFIALAKLTTTLAVATQANTVSSGISMMVSTGQQVVTLIICHTDTLFVENIMR